MMQRTSRFELEMKVAVPFGHSNLPTINQWDYEFLVSSSVTLISTSSPTTALAAQLPEPTP